MRLTIEQRSYIIKVYFEIYKTCVNVSDICNKIINEFKSKFNVIPPHRTSIRRLIKKFEKTGSVQNSKKKQTKSVLNEINLNIIKRSFINSPKKSLKNDHNILEFLVHQ
jgi:hypothetical protein